ncbi:MAG: hypothetical protein H7222_09045 [Methylotenera sp.]|nr:hypothetical protein [Oligoflexia bacterium]
MKGTIFQKPLEFKLNVEGESWRQGDGVQGTLLVKNHGSEAISLKDIHIHLAQGRLSKVRSKTEGAFKIQASAPISTPDDAEKFLAAGGELQLPWTFQTDRNCAITDVSTSLYILYGQGDAADKLGQIQLTFHPYPIIQEFLKTLTIDFRFVIKYQKFVKERLEIKLEPPTAKAFNFLECLFLYFYIEGDVINVSYAFQVKKLDASAASVDITKQSKTFDQSLAPHEYLMPSGRVNYTFFEAAIREAMKVVGA